MTEAGEGEESEWIPSPVKERSGNDIAFSGIGRRKVTGRHREPAPTPGDQPVAPTECTGRDAFATGKSWHSRIPRERETRGSQLGGWNDKRNGGIYLQINR